MIMSSLIDLRVAPIKSFVVFLHPVVFSNIVSLLHKILNHIVKETMVPSVAVAIEVVVTILILEVGVVLVVVVDMEVDT